MPVIGTRQSPIKIETKDTIAIAKPTDLFRIEYKDQDYRGTLEGGSSTHRNFKLDKPTAAKPAPTVYFQGKTFELQMIHIHGKSEHLIDSDNQSDYELHLVHLERVEPTEKQLTVPKLVIGILFREDATGNSGGGLERFNEMLSARKNTGASLKHIKSSEKKVVELFNPLAFFPRLGKSKKPDLVNWFHYEGSLTSEPYSEDVSWIVMKNESKIDLAKVDKLEEYAEQDARPVQSLDRRIILRSF